MTCQADGCDRDERKRGLCGMHYNQAWRAGEFERAPRSTTYIAIHHQLRKHRGPASDHPCAAPGCDRRATHWAWQRTGPSRTGERHDGTTVSWGTDLNDYAPMCRPHGAQLDHGGTLTHCAHGHDRAVFGEGTPGQCRECRRLLDARRRGKVSA